MDRQFLTTMDLQSKVKYALSGGIIGFIAWGHSPVYVAPSILLFFLYFQAQTRSNFFIAVFAYYLAASRGLFTGTITYYDNQILYAFIIWSGAAFVISIVWVIFWSNSPRAKPLFFLLASLLVILPPFGLIGWANPLLAAGLFFPGWGFFGVGTLLLSIIVFELYTRGRNRWIVSIIAVVTVMLLNYNFKPLEDSVFATTQTKYGKLYDEKNRDFMIDYKTGINFVGIANSVKSKNVLLPESAAGWWAQGNNTNMMIWGNLEPDKTVLTGASIQKNDSLTNDNVLLQIKNDGYKILYRQRVPVLVEMWRPWENTGTTAYLFRQKPVVSIDGIGKTGILICYEQLLFYTLMETMAYNPDRIIALSNLWWAKQTSIKEIQIASLELVSSLFNVPLSLSLNE
jgi:hypothetical protein